MATTDQTFEPPSGETSARAHSGRKPIDIERLLTWAYREELPKLQFLGAGLSGRWSNFALLGTKVQQGGGGTYYGSLDVGPPHEDAAVVHEAVTALDGLGAGPARGSGRAAVRHARRRAGRALSGLWRAIRCSCRHS